MVIEGKQLDENLIIKLEKTLRKAREAFNAAFHQHNFGVSFDQWLIIEQVKYKQGISQAEIAHITGKDRASISRMIRNLQEKSLLTKLNNQTNKRANKVYLTPEGLELADEMMKVYSTTYASQFKGILEQEINFLKEILTRINQNNFRPNKVE